MQKDLKSFDCKPLAWSHAQMKQWDELVNWLAFCITVLGLLEFWAQTLKDINMLRLNKYSMQGQYANTWSQNESKSPSQKHDGNMDQQKELRDFRYVQNQCQSMMDDMDDLDLDLLEAEVLAKEKKLAEVKQTFSACLQSLLASGCLIFCQCFGCQRAHVCQLRARREKHDKDAGHQDKTSLGESIWRPILKLRIAGCLRCPLPVQRVVWGHIRPSFFEHRFLSSL